MADLQIVNRIDGTCCMCNTPLTCMANKVTIEKFELSGNELKQVKKKQYIVCNKYDCIEMLENKLNDDGY